MKKECVTAINFIAFIIAFILTVIVCVTITVEILGEVTFNIPLISDQLTNFKSPFISKEDAPVPPSQIAFLTCIVASTLTLAVISNHLRDSKAALYRQKDLPEAQRLSVSTKEINDHIENAGIALRQINIMIWIHLLMTYLTSIRILENSFTQPEAFILKHIDFFLVFGTFLVFGILWPFYFAFYGGGSLKRLLDVNRR